MKYFTIIIILCMSNFNLSAQWVNRDSIWNKNGHWSSWGTQDINTVAGVYLTTGSTGTTNNFGVFEHGGQSGTGANAAFINNGVYDASVFGQDFFQGPGGGQGQQEIAGDSMPVFYEVYFVNGAASALNISNSNGIAVVSSLTFENGITTTVRNNNATGAVKFRAGSSYVNLYLGDTSYVNGYVTKTGNTAFEFPVGNQAGTDVRTLSITAPAAITDAVSVAYFSGDPGTNLDPTGGAHDRDSRSPAGVAGVSMLASVSDIGFWDWVPVSGTSSITVTASLPDMSVIPGFSDATKLRLVGWNTANSQWENLSGSGGASGNTEGSTLSGTVADMSAYSALGIGSVDVPLPVTLISFTGQVREHLAYLHWKVANEGNIAVYSVERSDDGRNYSHIGAVESSALSAYNFMDRKPLASPGSFYRLKMEGIDGTATYSKVILLRDDVGENQPSLSIYPNPVNGDALLYINLNNSNSVLKSYVMRNFAGQVVRSAPLTGNFARLMLSGLRDGVYVLQVTDDQNQIWTSSVVIKK